MLMVIFGAGASFDSSSDPGHGLPLAKDLVASKYNVIAAHSPASRAVISHVRGQMNGDSAVSLEHALAKFAANADGNYERQAQLIAFRFYLRELIGGQTNQCLSTTHGFTYYLQLFNYLHDWHRQSDEPIAIVTFNYDTLIENALETVVTGWKFIHERDFISRNDWKLMKLHGSVTWCRWASTPASNGSLSVLERAMRVADQIQFDQEALCPFDIWPPDNQTRAQQVNVPALAVPMENKTRFECPVGQVEAVRSIMPEVNRLLICGWRAAEKHAVELLNGVNPGYGLAIVAGDEMDLDETRRNLGFAGEKGNFVLAQPDGMSALASDLSQLERLLEESW